MFINTKNIICTKYALIYRLHTKYCSVIQGVLQFTTPYNLLYGIITAVFIQVLFFLSYLWAGSSLNIYYFYLFTSLICVN